MLAKDFVGTENVFRQYYCFVNSIDSFPFAFALLYRLVSLGEAICPGYKCNHKKFFAGFWIAIAQDTHSYIPRGNYQVEISYRYRFI